jgi:hypothetical protein
MLLESEIMAAQSISKTEAECARKLGVSFITYQKYAKMYGLYGRIANMAGKGISKAVTLAAIASKYRTGIHPGDDAAKAVTGG